MIDHDGVTSISAHENDFRLALVDSTATIVESIVKFGNYTVHRVIVISTDWGKLVGYTLDTPESFTSTRMRIQELLLHCWKPRLTVLNSIQTNILCLFQVIVNIYIASINRKSKWYVKEKIKSHLESGFISGNVEQKLTE